MSTISLKKKKLDKAADIDMKNHLITNLELPSNQRDTACVEFVNYRINNETQKNVLKIDGANSVTINLDLNDKKILNLKTDDDDLNSAANDGLVKYEISTNTTALTNFITKQLNESHISSPTNKKDAFRYLMEDADESSSVLGINDFPESPHQINKKAYDIQLVLEEDSPNQYRSRLGFNLHPLPVGYYTMVVEWFPPEMNEVGVTPEATTISISNHTTKIFEKCTKTLIHFHRWDSSPSQFIYLDQHGTVRVTTSVNGHLIVYGVKETVSNVDPSVYGTAFVIENGKMVMQTDLSLNGHRLRGSVHYINGILNTNNGNTFLLNGCDKIIIPNYSHILTTY